MRNLFESFDILESMLADSSKFWPISLNPYKIQSNQEEFKAVSSQIFALIPNNFGRQIFQCCLACMTKSIEISMIAIAFGESIMQMGKLPLFAKGVLDERHYTVDQKWCLERKKYVAVGKTLISLIHPLLTNHHQIGVR